jgi:predicted nucleic acid-binding protein
LDVRASLILILKLFNVLVYFLLSNESMLWPSKIKKLDGEPIKLYAPSSFLQEINKKLTKNKQSTNFSYLQLSKNVI